MTRPPPPHSPSTSEPRAVSETGVVTETRTITETRVVTEPADDVDPPQPPAKLPRATTERPPRHTAVPRAATQLPAVPPTPTHPAHTSSRPKRPSKLPYARQEIVGAIDERSHLPAKLPRSTADLGEAASRAHIAFARHTEARLTEPPPITGTAPPPFTGTASSAAGPDPSARVRARGTPTDELARGEQLRTLIFAPERTRAAWIERELCHAPITIQIGRRIRTIVAALVKDPPPRPQLLIVDFDAVSADEIVELHAVRQSGWDGRLIAVGNVWPELRASLAIDDVLAPPLVRDSLLDCVAGTRHATVTISCPVIPQLDDPASRR
jgi:hypothetical protein